MKLNLIVIKTDKLDQIKSQYEGLNIDFEYHRHGSGPFHYAATIDGLVFEIYPLPKSKAESDNSTRLGFEVSNLEKTVSTLKELEWIIKSEPVQMEWGFVAVVEDADGRKVELKQK